MPKVRTHNEYFRCVAPTKCPSCGSKRVQVWSWGEYVHGKWNTVMHFCDNCIDREVEPRLLEHAAECGCTFALVGYSGTRLSESLTRLQEKITQSFTHCSSN